MRPYPTYLFCLREIILVSGLRPRPILRHLDKINIMLDATSSNNCLLLARVSVFSTQSLMHVNYYLCNGKQWTKICRTFSSWHKIIFCFPKGQSWDLYFLTFILMAYFYSAQNFNILKGKSLKVEPWGTPNKILCHELNVLG